MTRCLIIGLLYKRAISCSLFAIGSGIAIEQDSFLDYLGLELLRMVSFDVHGQGYEITRDEFMNE